MTFNDLTEIKTYGEYVVCVKHADEPKAAGMLQALHAKSPEKYEQYKKKLREDYIKQNKLKPRFSR